MNLSDVMQLELSLLRAYGASIAIDNFGSGNSNLSKLKTLPVDRVKLDPALVKDLGSDAEARVIVQGLIGIIHGVGKQVVAQGVETHDQMEILEVMGCDAVQGYGIAHPMTQTDLWKWRAPSEAFRQKRVQ
jgi:diguanylate cyclase